jgi:hypothetical protein
MYTQPKSTRWSIPSAGGTRKMRELAWPSDMYGESAVTKSNGNIGSGKCIPSRNQPRCSSLARRSSLKSA